MHAWRCVYATFGRWALQAALLKCNIRTLKVKENATRQLMAIPKKDFSDCFEKWKECWDKCVRSQG